jgi:hypothetical protein
MEFRKDRKRKCDLKPYILRAQKMRDDVKHYEELIQRVQ